VHAAGRERPEDAQAVRVGQRREDALELVTGRPLHAIVKLVDHMSIYPDMYQAILQVAVRI
jgi:hypothetical protein